MLSELITNGKRTLFGVGVMALLLSCFSPKYAKRDYDLYPSNRKEIALYNIDQILRDICGDANETVVPVEDGVGCNFGCKRYGHAFDKNPYTGQMTAGPRQCLETNYHVFHYFWGNIGNVQVVDTCLHFNEEPRCALQLRDRRQAVELKEAIDVYLPSLSR